MLERIIAYLLAACLIIACGEAAEVDVDDDDTEQPSRTLKTNAPVSFAVVYESGTRVVTNYPTPRHWLPVDLSVSPDDELWVVQRLRRDDTLTDINECTAATQADCTGLEGSTVALLDVELDEPASEANSRATLVIDFNSWHFMRRPSSIAFGAEEVWIDPDDLGAAGTLTERTYYKNTFATCHEHYTGNFTDHLVTPFIGPTLWTADPSIYNGKNGPHAWSNGSHLDMVHATPYCMGIAHEYDSVYWTFNGDIGTLDRYDFVRPHVPGHSYHMDAVVTRFQFGSGLNRVVDVPSNMMVSGSTLYIADTGNKRIVTLDLNAEETATATFQTHEGLVADIVTNISLQTLVPQSILSALWGSTVEPSGLGVLDNDTLVVGNHGSGHLLIVGMDGEVLRSIDTGLGAGIGGLTVKSGVVYFTHLGERKVYRMDVGQ